jgi:hypothetical protein
MALSTNIVPTMVHGNEIIQKFILYCQVIESHYVKIVVVLFVFYGNLFVWQLLFRKY